MFDALPLAVQAYIRHLEARLSSVFDRVWVVMFDEIGEVKPLVRQPQAMMPGDGKAWRAGRVTHV